MSGLVRVLDPHGGVVDPRWTNSDYAYALACGMGDALYVASSERVHRYSTTDGSADPNWTVFASYVEAIALDASGNVYIAGRFTSVNQRDRDRIAKLSPAGKVDADWIAALPGSPDDAPVALAIDAHGNVFAGGPFGLLKLSGSTGAPMPEWQASNGSVHALAISTDGASLYVGGWFAEMGGAQRTHLARLSTETGIADPQWRPEPNSFVSSLVVDPGDHLWIGGVFDHVDGEERTGLATLDPNGMPLAPPVETLRPGSIDDLAVRPDQSVIAGGEFIRVNGSPRRHALHLFADGTLDAAWAPSLPMRTWKVTVAGNDVVYAAGDEAPRGSSRSLRITKVANGQVDPAWSSHADGWLRTLMTDASGHVYIAGDFTVVDGLPHAGGFARISPQTGEPDPGWASLVEGGRVSVVASGDDGNLYLGGTFTHVGGFERTGLARLSADDGMPDSTWNPAPIGLVFAIALGPGGDIYVGGQGPFVKRLSRVDASVDIGWRAELFPVFSDFPWAYYVSSIAADANGTVYLHGNFSVGDLYERAFARFSGQNGLLDADWGPSLRGTIESIALAPDANRLYLGGRFDRAGGSPRQGIAAFQTSLTDRLFAAGFESGWPMPVPARIDSPNSAREPAG